MRRPPSTMSPERIPETSDLRIVFRGYDVDQVNELVASLIDAGAAPGAPASPESAGRSAIERIAEKSKSILMAAHETAEQLRLEAEAHAETVRANADAYAEGVEATAEQRIAELTRDGELEAERIARAAHADQVDLIEMIEELREHREALAADLERLRGYLLDIEESLHVVDDWLDDAAPDEGDLEGEGNEEE